MAFWFRRCRGKGIVKRAVLGLLAVFLAIVLAGCAGSPDKVKLMTRKQIIKYCGEEFGACELVGVHEAGNRRECTLRDVGKGFEYTFVSYAAPVGLDGAVFGYTESHGCTFPDAYMENFLGTYDSVFSGFETGGCSADMDGSRRVLTGPDDAVIDFGGAVYRAMVEYDTRKYWADDDRVFLEDLDGNDLGQYSVERGYLDQDTVENEWLLDRAAGNMGVPVDKLSMVSWEFTQYDSLPGHDKTARVNVVGTDNDTRDTCRVVRFTYKGETYFVADVVVYAMIPCNYGRTRYFGDFPVR